MTTVEGEVVESRDLAPVRESAIASPAELTVDEMVSQMARIQDAMKRAMRDGEHYGVIPGTNKPTLLKPGAEKLCLMFRLAPTYPEKDKTWHDDGHLTVTATCRLQHIGTGNLIAEGEGLCSTREVKYAYRRATRKCPSCGVEAIVKQKEEKGGNFICVGNDKGGCWTKYNKNDRAILDQPTGRVDNEDLADSYNTVLKMACKRALIAAVLNGTAASDIFTQDIGDDDVPPTNERRDSSGEGTPSHPPKDIGTEAPPDSSQGSESGGLGASADPSPEPSAAEGTPDDAAAPATSPESGPVDSQGAGPSPWEAIQNAVDAHLVKKVDVLRKASTVAARDHAMPESGVSWDSLKDLPEAVLAEVATELGLDQEAML